MTSSLILATILSLASAPQNIIDWKPGDTLSYNVYVEGQGLVGTSEKTCSSDAGKSVWLRQTTKIGDLSSTTESLISKYDGALQKIIVNGVEQPLSDYDFTITLWERVRKTFPLGTFWTFHVGGHSPKIKYAELWIEGGHTALDGQLRQIVTANDMTITLDLVSFIKVPRTAQKDSRSILTVE